MKNLKWWIKWPLVAAAILLILTLILPLVPLNFLKPAVESRLSNMLGRNVSVGSLRLSLWGGSSLTISNMTADEDPAFGDGQFLKAQTVQADFSILKYIFQWKLEIESLVVKSPDFTFIKNRDGAWSWTTIGSKESGAQKNARAPYQHIPYSSLAPLINLVDGGESNTRPSKIHIEGASVRLVNLTKEQPSETIYKNILLHASVATAYEGSTVKGRHVTGELEANSSESDGAEILIAALPFDLNISRDQSAGLTVTGTVGPGPFQTRNFNAGSFKINCQFSSPPKTEAAANTGSASGLRGQGHITAANVTLSNVNISENVASKLRLSAIGDMNPGTAIGSLETDFQIDQGIYRTSNLQVKNLDGLGDAAAEQGWFTIDPALTLNYAARITLSDQITNQVKATLGPLASLIEISGPLSVALNITGDVRSPQISVDVIKTLGLGNVLR